MATRFSTREAAPPHRLATSISGITGSSCEGSCFCPSRHIRTHGSLHTLQKNFHCVSPAKCKTDMSKQCSGCGLYGQNIGEHRIAARASTAAAFGHQQRTFRSYKQYCAHRKSTLLVMTTPSPTDSPQPSACLINNGSVLLYRSPRIREGRASATITPK